MTRPSRWRWHVKLPAFIVIAIAILGVTGCGTSDDAQADTDPATVVESYFDAYNASDFDDVMTHFSEESVIVGHPTDADPTAPDIYEIRQLHKVDLAFGEQYRVFNLRSQGNKVTWDTIWGEDGCVAGHSAVVAEGVILEWVFGDFAECSEIE